MNEVKMNTVSETFEGLIITRSKVLQLRSHPEALHVKLKIFIAILCKFGVELPNKPHHSTAKIIELTI